MRTAAVLDSRAGAWFMKLVARQPILLATACCALLGAGSSTPSFGSGTPSLPAREPAAADTPGAASVPGDEGERWLEATRAALDQATEVRMPFADELVELDAGHVAVAYAFRGLTGQPLEIELRRDPSASGTVYVEVFRVLDVLGEPLHERLSGLRPSASRVKTRL